MWGAIRTLRIFVKTLIRIAVALEKIQALYTADCASRGIGLTDYTVIDPVEVSYGPQPVKEEW
jgi:hypothetical protein